VFFREDFYQGKVHLPKLKNLVIHVDGPPRINMPALIFNLRENFVSNSIAPERLWINHPLVHTGKLLAFFFRAFNETDMYIILII